MMRAGLFGLVLVVCGAQASMVGGLSGAYLRGPVGAAPLALGNAYSASPDYLAPWWNPAVLANLREKKLAAGLGFRSLGRSDAYASFEFRVPPRVGMGLFFLYRGDPFLDDLYDENEQPISGAKYTTLTGKIGLSYYITRSLSIGASIGILYQSLPTGGYHGGDIIYSSSFDIGAIDLALVYKISDRWSVAALLRDVGAGMNWEINAGEYVNSTVEDRMLPYLILASTLKRELMQRPFIWNIDFRGYIFDGSWERLPRPEAVVNTGWEWRYWEKFYIRAGVADLLINGDLVNDRQTYVDDFSIRLTGGFSLDLEKVKHGLKLNYGISTDKVWAGVDQQLDILLSF